MVCWEEDTILRYKTKDKLYALKSLKNVVCNCLTNDYKLIKRGKYLKIFVLLQPPFPKGTPPPSTSIKISNISHVLINCNE
jgi:hypothetical protein